MKGTGNIAGAFGVDMTSIDGGDLIVSNAQGTTTIGTIEGKTNSGLKMSSQGTGAGDIVINRTGGTIKGKTYGAELSAAKTALAGLPYTGNVTVKFDGTMEGATDDALRALTDLGNIDIEGSGTFIGVSSGINAHSDGGNVKIHLYKAANVTANGASSSAVHALQTDTTDGVDMEVINEGTLRNTGSGGGTTYGINAANFAKSANADTADIHVVNNGQIEVSGDNAFAIRASANQGNVVVDGNGSVKVTGTGLTEASTLKVQKATFRWWPGPLRSPPNPAAGRLALLHPTAMSRSRAMARSTEGPWVSWARATPAPSPLP